MKRKQFFQAIAAIGLGSLIPKVVEDGTVIYVESRLNHADKQGHTLGIKKHLPHIRLAGCKPEYFMHTYQKMDVSWYPSLCGIHFGPEQYAAIQELYLDKIRVALDNNDIKAAKLLSDYVTKTLKNRKAEKHFVPELYDYKWHKKYPIV